MILIYHQNCRAINLQHNPETYRKQVENLLPKAQQIFYLYLPAKNHKQMLETYPVPRLSEHDFAETDKQAQDWICNASYYDRFFKAQAGCFDNIELEERNIPNPLDRNPAYTAYKEYMGTGYVDLETLKKQEVDKANAQSLSSFAQQHGIDIADLQNLIQSVDEYNEAQKP